MAGAIATVIALGIVFGGRVYTTMVDLWHGYAQEPIERVHVELLSTWLLSRANADGGDAEAKAFEDLLAALDEGGISKLRTIAVELREEPSGEPEVQAEALAGHLTAWNDALDEAGAPFVVRGGVLQSTGGPQLFITSARTLYDGVAEVGSESARIRIVERIDGTNVRESVLGENVEVAGGGLLLSDRVLEFSIDRIWPILDPEAEPTAWTATLAEEVRAEVRRDLPPQSYAVLEGLARARLAAVEASLATQSRLSCSGFLFPRVGWNGVSAMDREKLQRYVSSDDCPALTEQEFDAVRTFTDRAAAEPALEDAVTALVAWSLRPIALHEARHAADAIVTGDLLEPVACHGCGELGNRVRNEVSAYVAEFAWTSAPATAVYQACLAVENSGGSHRAAIEFLFEELDGDCIFGLPDRAAVREFEERAFGREQEIVLGESFPVSVPIPPRARRSAAGG